MTNPTPHGQVPEALRPAEEITNLVCSSEAAAKTIAAAADELCRLHVENASLRAQQPASPPAEQQAPSAAAADTVVLEAALRAIHQAIDLIGEPDTERLRTVRRVLRGAVIVAEDAGEAATAPQPAPAPLSEQDPLQGAANWLVTAHPALETSTLAGKLSIGYNRAKRLHDAARKQGGA